MEEYKYIPDEVKIQNSANKGQNKSVIYRKRYEKTNSAPDFIFDNFKWHKLVEAGVQTDGGQLIDAYKPVKIKWQEFLKDLAVEAAKHKDNIKYKRYEYVQPKKKQGVSKA